METSISSKKKDSEPGKDTHFIGRWGSLHLRFLQENQPDVHRELQAKGQLYAYLIEFNEQAKERHALIMQQLLQDTPLIESLEQPSNTSWETKINTLCAIADEIIIREMVNA